MFDARRAFVVIDDDPGTADVLGSVLRTFGTVATARSVAEGQAAIERCRPTIIFLDIGLPDLDGRLFLARLRQQPRFRSVPVILITARASSDDQVLGFDAGADDYVIKPFDVRVLESRIRNHIARATRRQKLHDRVSRDDLTGIFNRKRFFDQFAAEVSRASRSGAGLSLILLDIDRFKALNDSHGHDAGDRVLAAVGGLLRRRLRGTDTVARIGGEEFGILLPETRLGNARDVAEDLRHDLQARIHLSCDLPDPVTASFGIGHLHAGEDMAGFRKRVDDALYRSKENGRNAVTAG